MVAMIIYYYYYYDGKLWPCPQVFFNVAHMPYARYCTCILQIFGVIFLHKMQASLS